MTNIISFKDKKGLVEQKQAELIRKRKVLAVRKVFQCTHCAMKCEKCSVHINPEEQSKRSNDLRMAVPYHFCESCAEEYIDYIQRLHGKGDPDCYWHNAAWLESWKAWIDYQGAIDRYLKTKEFLQLLQELKQTRPDK